MTPTRMKAIGFRRYGPPDVLGLIELDKPTPRDSEALVRILATTVTPGDCEVRRFQFPFWIWLPLRCYMGIFRPRRPVLGMEFSGVVESVGQAVTSVRVGDAVFGGMGLPFGTYAEYRCQSAATLVIKPESIPHPDAATISVGGVNALHYLRKGNVRAGDRVLINGAAGCFGTYAVQLAKHFGAVVTAVDRTDKLDCLRELGADHVIDYTRYDFTTNGMQYDVILDIAGTAPYSRCLQSLTPGGRLVLANPKFWQMLRAPWTSLFRKKKVTFAFSHESTADLDYLADLMAKGIIRAVIDRRFPLEDVPTAHRFVESGAKIGHVVIEILPSP